MELIELELPVVGIRFLESVKDVDADAYEGVSYCDAVRLATYGQRLVLKPGCISTCRWSPVILGLKDPETEFEKSLEPRVTGKTAAVYVAPLAAFKGSAPDVVIVRGRPGQLRELASALGEGALSKKYAGLIGKTALGVEDRTLSPRKMLSLVSNRAVAALKRSKTFDRLTRTIFKNEKVTAAFEKVLKNALADMSMCRNSTVLPMTEDAGNISFFCTGGVTWGINSPANMTSGWPGRMVPEILELVEFPGKSACEGGTW